MYELNEKSGLEDFNKIIKNVLDRSRRLNDEDYDKFLCNVMLLIKDNNMLKRRSKSDLLENKNFRKFIS